MPAPLFRLTFDVPYTFATEPGCVRSVHCSDFAPAHGILENTTREPLTGLLMLTPSVQKRTWAEDMKGLDQWRHNPAFWREVKRAQENQQAGASLLSTVKPADQAHTLIEILTQTALVAIEASTLYSDDLKWALESNFFLESDEGFALHYHGLSDEMLRKENWFGVQWDNLYLHFSSHGRVKVYRYADRAHLERTPAFVEEFQIANAGDLLGRAGYFHFIPVPGYGLLVYHNLRGQKSGVVASNADTRTAPGSHLIRHAKITGKPVPASGNFRLFERSPVRLALNPYQAHVVGFQNLRYPLSGSYADAPLDPGYTPSAAPAVTTALYLRTGHGAATATLKNTKNDAAWTAGVDRQARVSMSLTTTDARYTPFVYGYGIAWNPVMTARNTTPFEPDILMRLEFSHDDYGRFEGRARVLLESAAGRAAAERGDATFLLEASEDGGTTWQTIAGGLADFGKPTAVQDNVGFYYECDVALNDMWQRFDEVHETLASAFDGVPLGDAFNIVFSAAGFAPIAPTAALQAIKIKGAEGGQRWRFAPGAGDDGQKIIKAFLLLLRRQKSEWRARFDWDAAAWNVEPKPRYDDPDTQAWTLTAWSDEANIPGRVLRYSDYKPSPEPPEANVTTVTGVSGGEPSTVLVKSAPCVNVASLRDPTSVDYLGRVKLADFQVEAISDPDEVNIMNRRVFEACGHRRFQANYQCPDVVLALRPNTKVTGRAFNALRQRASVYTGYLKKRTIIIEQDGVGEMRLECDSEFLGEIA